MEDRSKFWPAFCFATGRSKLKSEPFHFFPPCLLPWSKVWNRQWMVRTQNDCFKLMKCLVWSHWGWFEATKPFQSCSNEPSWGVGSSRNGVSLRNAEWNDNLITFCHGTQIAYFDLLRLREKQCWQKQRLNFRFKPLSIFSQVTYEDMLTPHLEQRTLNVLLVLFWRISDAQFLALIWPIPRHLSA